MDVGDIRAIVLDVDGVLTDGRIYLAAGGEALKVFWVQDGSAIQAWQAAGGRLALVSGRESLIVARRAAELGVREVRQGVADKLVALRELLAAWSLPAGQVCYVGDDLPDLPAMRACGFPVAVSGAAREVQRQAARVTTRPGGGGAVREIIEFLMQHKSPP